MPLPHRQGSGWLCCRITPPISFPRLNPLPFGKGEANTDQPIAAHQRFLFSIQASSCDARRFLNWARNRTSSTIFATSGAAAAGKFVLAYVFSSAPRESSEKNVNKLGP